MKNFNTNNRFSFGNAFKPNRLSAVLCFISVLLLVVLIVMILLIPKSLESSPTDAATLLPETAAPTEPTKLPEPIFVTQPPTEPIETEPLVMLEHMAELYEQNAHTAGWITIADTNIDSVVMYSPENPTKYHHWLFEDRYKYRGEFYIDGACKLEPESTTILIRGHNMNDGSMFHDLVNYKSEEYWKKHPTITFTTLYEERTYEIFAAFRDKVYDDSEDVFKYYRFIDPVGEMEFNSGIAYFLEKTPYDMGVEVEYGDRLLMLSTCDRTITDGRFVVVAKLVDESQTESSVG